MKAYQINAYEEIREKLKHVEKALEMAEEEYSKGEDFKGATSLVLVVDILRALAKGVSDYAKPTWNRVFEEGGGAS